MIFDPLKSILIAWLTEGIKEVYNFVQAQLAARFPWFKLPPLNDWGSLAAQAIINAVLAWANATAAQLPVTAQNVLIAVVAWLVSVLTTAAAYRIVVRPLVKLAAAAEAYAKEKMPAPKKAGK